MAESQAELDNLSSDTLESESDGKPRTQELPGDLGKVFLAIENQVISLNAEWNAYEQLFAAEDDWRMLVRSSPFGWTLIHDAIVERCILRITRIVESGKRRMTFIHVIEILKSLQHNDLVKSLHVQLVSIKAKVVPLKELRDKVLAHSDRGVGTGEVSYPVVSLGMIRDLMPEIAQFCQSVRSHFGLSPFAYDWCLGAWAGGIVEDQRMIQQFRDLKRRLVRGELASEGNLPREVLGIGRTKR
jgi:hypothetical protein